MKTKTNPSKTGKSLLLTFYEGFSTYTITLPMPYALRFFAEGLLTSLEMLSEVEETRITLSGKDAEKAHIQEVLRKAVKSYEGYLKTE